MSNEPSGKSEKTHEAEVEAAKKDAEITETERAIASKVAATRAASAAIVDASLKLAKAAYVTRPSSQQMKAVTPGQPAPAGDLTGKFAAHMPK